MSSIRPAVLFTGAGAVGGSAVGFALGGPAGALEGAKVGGAFGMQAAMLNKGEELIDKTANGIGKGIDATGNKIGKAADQAIASLNEAQKKFIDMLEGIAHTGSTLMLAGYVIQLSLYGSSECTKLYETFCKESMFQSVNCFTKSLTCISFDSLIIATGGCLAKKAYHVLFPHQKA